MQEESNRYLNTNGLRILNGQDLASKNMYRLSQNNSKKEEKKLIILWIPKKLFSISKIKRSMVTN